MLFQTAAGVVSRCLVMVDKVLGLICKADFKITSTDVTLPPKPRRCPYQSRCLSDCHCHIYIPPHLTPPHSSQLHNPLVSLGEAQTQGLCAQACGNRANVETISSHAESFPSVFDARALTNCRLFALDADDFQKAADQYPGVKSKLQAWAIRSKLCQALS